MWFDGGGEIECFEAGSIDRRRFDGVLLLVAVGGFEWKSKSVAIEDLG